MELALLRFDWRPLRWAALALVLVVAFGINLRMLSDLAGWWRMGLFATDWSQLAGLDANPYDTSAFRWTPPAGWLWSTLIEPVGLGLWRALHIAVLALLPWRVAFIALVSAPFWFDVANGNVMTFVLVAAWHALAGNRAGVVAFAILAALIPRPLMLPVLAVIVWRYPLARWTFAVSGIVVAAWTIGGGMLDDMLGRLLKSSGEMALPYNLAPSHWIGVWWVPIGLVAGATLTRYGRYGLASIAVSPYLFHYYLLMGLLELRQGDAKGRRQLRTRPTRPGDPRPVGVGAPRLDDVLVSRRRGR